MIEYQRYLDNVVWELTLKCNAHCAHCGSAAGIDRKDNLTLAEILRVCDELRDLRCLKVTLIGGEMFLHHDWKEILKRLSDNGIEVAVVTNGILLNSEIIRILNDYHVSVVGISLDGPNASIHDSVRGVKGAFNKIFSLSEAFDHKMPAVAVTTVTNKNMDSLPEFLPLLKKSYFKGWQIQIGAPFGRMAYATSLNELEYYILGIFIALAQKRTNIEDLDVMGTHCIGYYSKLIPDSVSCFAENWNGCPAGKYVLGIRSNGMVTGCLSIYDDSFLEKSLKETSLEKIWNDKDLCLWNKQRYKNLSGFCKDCVYAPACCAGCASIAQAYGRNVGEALRCFHQTEVKYAKYQGDDDYSILMRFLVNGNITNDGFFLPENYDKIDLSFIEKFGINENIKRKLKILL